PPRHVAPGRPRPRVRSRPDAPPGAEAARQTPSRRRAHRAHPDLARRNSRHNSQPNSRHNSCPSRPHPEAVMVIALAFLVLIALLVISAYASRLYTESGRFLSREFQENIELFEHQIEPRLGFNHRRAALSFALLEQLLTAAICFLLAYSVFSRPGWSAEEAAQAVLFAILVILLFDRFLPFLFFSRTRGGWLVRFTFLLRLLICAVFPLTLFLGFLQSVVSLTRPENTGEEPEHPSEAVDALIEAGQDEGILEESDRELIHSVVEFGDKTVRDVMTPRPS